jgi:hypothetical protein
LVKNNDWYFMAWGLKGYIGFARNLHHYVCRQPLSPNERTSIEGIIADLTAVLAEDLEHGKKPAAMRGRDCGKHPGETTV